MEGPSGMNNRGKSMWRTSPGGGGASGGMVAHDLVNGCQATARRDERSEPPEASPPPRLVLYMEKSGTTSFGVRAKTFSAHVVTVF